MWYLPFWIFFAVSLIAAGISLVIRKPRFIDIQIFLMAAALVMSCDMIFCKQYHLYHYGLEGYAGWYSFWANLFIIPALGIVFIKFVPEGLKGVLIYIAVWTIAFTWFEIFVTAPLGILHYTGWKVFPYSTIGYIIAFSLEYGYYKMLLKHCSK